MKKIFSDAIKHLLMIKLWVRKAWKRGLVEWRNNAQGILVVSLWHHFITYFFLGDLCYRWLQEIYERVLIWIIQRLTLWFMFFEMWKSARPSVLLHFFGGNNLLHDDFVIKKIFFTLISECIYRLLDLEIKFYIEKRLEWSFSIFKKDWGCLASKEFEWRPL
jgi:hypothetical protein